MKAIAEIVFLLAFFSIEGVAGKSNNNTEKVTAKEITRGVVTFQGGSCKYFETFSSNSKKRGVGINSCKRGNVDLGQNCEYFGANPHSCRKYNKQHKAYYKLLAESAVENGAPCAKGSISETMCDLTYPCTAGTCPHKVKAEDISGKVALQGGGSCKYYEMRSSNSLKRGIRIYSCKRNNIDLKKDCEYYGTNPHNCRAYNKNQPRYYELLAQSAVENGAPCAKESISETMCGLTYPCTTGSCPHQVKAEDISGKVALQGGGSCKYYEMRSSNSLKRGIRILTCKRNNVDLKKDCAYYGTNPHDCRAYNKNQPRYYELLAKSAVENGAPCAKESISETMCYLTYPCWQGSCLS